MSATAERLLVENRFQRIADRDAPLSEPQDRGRDAGFHTTRWTVVLQARGDSPEARLALGQLCEAYCNPVYRFLRREGRDEHRSRDLAQEFFTRLLDGRGIDGVDPAKGRFRSYLLGALKHFLADERRDERRLKRGGGATPRSIDSAGTDSAPGLQISDPAGGVPDSFFDRDWALSVMERGLETVRTEFERAGRVEQFDVLKPWLVGDNGKLSQADAAAALDMSTGAVKVAVHRLRKCVREAVRAEIAQTIDDPEDVAEELRYLVEVLSRGGAETASGRRPRGRGEG